MCSVQLDICVSILCMSCSLLHAKELVQKVPVIIEDLLGLEICSLFCCLFKLISLVFFCCLLPVNIMLSNFFMFCILCGSQEDQLKLMRLPYQNTILSITVPVMAYVTSAVPSIGTGGGGTVTLPENLT